MLAFGCLGNGTASTMCTHAPRRYGLQKRIPFNVSYFTRYGVAIAMVFQQLTRNEIENKFEKKCATSLFFLFLQS